MELDELTERLGAQGERREVELLAARLDHRAPADWRNLAAVLALTERAPVVGVSGGQGSGKSTLARLFIAAIELTGRSAATCSLDDFYLSRHRREELARAVHPLLATRGVPGTHDVELALETLDGLASQGTTLVPVFDKGHDDVSPQSEWKVVAGPVAQVVFEGWCLGAPPEPQARLGRPVNALESREDADGRWRRHVNQCLADHYQRLWQRLDFLVYLQVPDFAAVGRWRAQQEEQLPAPRRMTPGTLQRFLAHYERLTLWMLEVMPGRADLIVKLNTDHTVADVRRT